MHVAQPLVSRPTDISVDSLAEQMTLAEKIGQMTQAEKNSIPPEDVSTYFVGSVLSGGGGNPEPNTPETWASMVRAYHEAALKTRLRIPVIYGSDAVHGHSNMRGAVIFPHNIGMGATRDPELVRRAAHVTAREMMAAGVHFNFAPAVSVPQDIRWGRTYEGYSEDPSIVVPLGVASVEEQQNGDPRVLASVKHFVADGGTKWGTSLTYDWIQGNWQAPGDSFSIDQGNADADEATLRSVHLAPYVAAVKAGALNIMVSFSSWQGTKMHANRYLITDVLKGELGFSGFVISDWMAVNQIDRDYRTSVTSAINAGIDMVMVPYDYKLFIKTLTEAVESGAVSQERIDDAVRRILRVKKWLGVFESPFGRDDLLASVGSAEHRAVAREAVRKTLVLLKNENNTLPLSKNALILVAGRGADDIGMQCGGWSITWQGDHGATTLGTSLLEGMRQVAGDSAEIGYSADGQFEGSEKAEIGVVVVGESPYAEGMGDNGNLKLSAADQELVTRMRERCSKLVVVVLSGRPILITEQLAQADAMVAAFLPGTESQGVADVLFGDHPFTGKLSYSWPRSIEQVPLTALKQHPDGPLFPLGYGLTY
ncbi:MAG: glycoside hydrolase family 3 C-terminal domain-containing protein [Anaerolineae bacterium]|nr:glycoside hydrolase family 3 C-terminal domain-containing protein [Anaerolineae bacterium]